MKEPEQERDEGLWKALDGFGGIEPEPKSRARFWARVAREQSGRPQTPIWAAIFRYLVPIAGVAAVLAAALIGGAVLVDHMRADREIAVNMELYQDYEVIQNMPQLASYEDRDDSEDLSEIIE